MTLILYNVEQIRTTSKTVKSNATDLQTAIQTFFSTSQTALSGTLPALNTALSDFLSSCQPALQRLGTDRQALGAKVDTVATDAKLEDQAWAKTFQPGAHTKTAR